ncbi:expressed unknown protein [Seminavis robusta]|uniref:Fe2OG dioxygenase domain-containing protein n=1 Tax=Seminavis robusta TaxID=568900 RepID=A0A9N8H4E6_9STRA|nr:expressed unknown protein [Seminavis robusta]|eukprot:Sro83_g044190.1 n/a (679) ;mRNA; f:14829-16976
MVNPKALNSRDLNYNDRDRAPEADQVIPKKIRKFAPPPVNNDEYQNRSPEIAPKVNTKDQYNDNDDDTFQQGNNTNGYRSQQNWKRGYQPSNQGGNPGTGRFQRGASSGRGLGNQDTYQEDDDDDSYQNGNNNSNGNYNNRPNSKRGYQRGGPPSTNNRFQRGPSCGRELSNQDSFQDDDEDSYQSGGNNNDGNFNNQSNYKRGYQASYQGGGPPSNSRFQRGQSSGRDLSNQDNCNEDDNENGSNQNVNEVRGKQNWNQGRRPFNNNNQGGDDNNQRPKRWNNNNGNFNNGTFNKNFQHRRHSDPSYSYNNQNFRAGPSKITYFIQPREDDKLPKDMQKDPRGTDPNHRMNKKATFRGAGRNTESFDPTTTLVRPDARVVVASPHIEQFNKKLRHDDVVIVPELFGKEDDWSIYYDLVKEVTALQNSNVEGSEFLPWHEGAHLICRSPQGSKTYQMVVDRICRYFQIDAATAGIRFNWYKDTLDWKPFHHDSAAFNPRRARSQNITVGVSFGEMRELAFIKAQSNQDQKKQQDPPRLYFPQTNNGVFTIGRDVNIRWKHGVNALHPEDQANGKGRISIILWGLAKGVIDEEGSPPLLGSDGVGPHAASHRPHFHHNGPGYQPRYNPYNNSNNQNGYNNSNNQTGHHDHANKKRRWDQQSSDVNTLKESDQQPDVTAA